MNRSLRLVSILAMLGASGLVLAQDSGETDAEVGSTERRGTSEGSDAPASEGDATAEEGTQVAEPQPAGPAMDVDFDGRMGTMEEQVNTLKEQVFRSKATLQLLKEIVIQGGSTGARSTVYHVNDLGRGYTVESVAYYLDGQSIFAKQDPNGSLDAATELKVWDGAIPPGSHTLSVNMVLKGNGYGVFNYVDGYTFKVSSNYAFVAEEGEQTAVRVTVDERKGPWVRYDERPTVDYELQTISMREEE